MITDYYLNNRGSGSKTQFLKISEMFLLLSKLNQIDIFNDKNI
jgi:hypothetical protein